MRTSSLVTASVSGGSLRSAPASHRPERTWRRRARRLLSVAFALLPGLDSAGADPAPVARHDKLPIEVLSADSAPLQRDRDVATFQGNVKIRRQDTLLHADRITFDRRTDLLTAEGHVRLQDPSFDLTCSHLLFRVRENRGVAWGRPKVIQQLKAEKAQKGWIDLRAVQVKFYSTEKRISALEDVVLVQYETERGLAKPTFRIRCTSMDALLESHRSVFKDGVTVDTPEVGARGDRVYFHQLERKFYVVGRASAWNYDDKGKPINVISGNKIVHFFDERRSVVLGSVTARVFPEQDTKPRPLVVEREPEGED